MSIQMDVQAENYVFQAMQKLISVITMCLTLFQIMLAVKHTEIEL